MTYTPDMLDVRATALRHLRMEMEADDTDGADNESLAYFALAIASVEQAFRFMELAQLKQVAAVAKLERW